MIPDPPTASCRGASPHVPALCRRKRSAAAFAWAEPQMADDPATLDEHDVHRWIDRLARRCELTLLLDAEHGESADRLMGRPLGLPPGARA